MFEENIWNCFEEYDINNTSDTHKTTDIGTIQEKTENLAIIAEAYQCVDCKSVNLDY